MFGGFAIGSYILLVCTLTDQIPGDVDIAFAGGPYQRSPFLFVLDVFIPPLQNALFEVFDVPLLNRFLQLVRPVSPLRTDHCF